MGGSRWFALCPNNATLRSRFRGKLGGGTGEGQAMQFGYFTLSDNHYENNPRTANRLVADILDEAVYAEAVGLHSAWIGEHHFSTLGVLSCPELVLAQVAARTARIRLAPAVTVLPLHHPIRVAETWATLDLLYGGRVDFAAGRGYDRREYGPLGASFDDNRSVFAEGLEVVRALWASERPVSHRGRHYRFDEVAITPQPVQRPIPCYVAAFSPPSIELAARLGCNLIVAPFAAAMTFGAAELPLFRRDRRSPGQGAAAGPRRELGAARPPGGDRRDPEKGRGRRHRRGHPLRQCRAQAARPGQGRNGPVHGGGGARLRLILR